MRTSVKLQVVAACVMLFSFSVNAQNFGIGVATPQEKADIDGAIKIGTASNANDGTIEYSEIGRAHV